MTLVMSLLVVPFGVLAALYLREYAKQGALVSVVRVAVNNLAGVPSIVFGVFGLLNWAVAGAASLYAVYLKYFEATTFIQTPLPLIAVTTFNAGVMSILMGFLAELLMRTYFESQEKRPYSIRRTVNLGDPAE